MAHPVDGDIIVSRSLAGTGTYDVRIEPGPPQLILSGRRTALRRACDFAGRKGVDAWWGQGKTFRRLARHRANA